MLPTGLLLLGYYSLKEIFVRRKTARDKFHPEINIIKLVILPILIFDIIYFTTWDRNSFIKCF